MCQWIVDAINFIAEMHLHFRPQLFSGFITLAGFLFAVKSFALVNLVREVLNTPEYRERVQANIDAGESDTTIYGPLKGLTGILQNGIYICIAAALVQLLSGKSSGAFISVFGAVVSVSAISYCAYAVYKLTKNLHVYVDFLEEVGQKKLKQENAEREKKKNEGKAE